MSTASAARLPDHFPAGTKFVVEGEDAADGGVRIVKRYLVYPDGRTLDLLAGAPRLFDCSARRKSGATRHRRIAPDCKNRAVLQ